MYFIRFFIFLILSYLNLFSTFIWAHSLDEVGARVYLQDSELQFTANIATDLFLNDQGVNLLGQHDSISLADVNDKTEIIESYLDSKVVFLDEESQLLILTNFNFTPLSQDLEPVLNSQQEVAFVQVNATYNWSVMPTNIYIRYGLLPDTESIHLQIIDESNLMLSTLDLNQDNYFINLNLTNSMAEVEGVSGQKVRDVWLTGVWHVLEGLDHILFIFSLVLVTKKLKQIILPITVFTLCHSLTLGLIAQGVTHSIPNWIIEASIAGSILVILSYELVTESFKRLWLVTGILGIIHGMGFAQALTDTLGDLNQWANALVKLTIAIELTQVMIALIAFSLISLVTYILPKYQKYGILSFQFSIAGLALFWFLERIS